MSTALPIGPNTRMDNYAQQNGWDGRDIGAQPPMNRRQYKRWWKKYQRWIRLPEDRRRGDP
jgi:hypothetical protein